MDSATLPRSERDKRRPRKSWQTLLTLACMAHVVLLMFGYRPLRDLTTPEKVGTMIRLLTIIVAFCVAGPLLAEDPKAKDLPPAAVKPGENAEKSAHHLSQPIVKDVDEIPNLIFAETETTFEEFSDTLGKLFFPMMEKEGENGTVYWGAPIFIYHGASKDPKAKFKFTVGFAVKPESKPIGEFKIKKVDGYRCVSVYYTGPLSSISKAYEAVFAEIGKSGHKPTGQSRELYLDWHGEDSANTVVEVQVGIEGRKSSKTVDPKVEAPKPESK